MHVLAKLGRKPFVAALLSILFGFIVASIIIACMGQNPFMVFGGAFGYMFSSPSCISNLLIRSTPLIIVAIGVSFAFKSGLFNLGAEGQYIAGALCANLVGYLCNFHPVIQIPLVLIAGMLGGGLCGAFEGFLRAKFGISEIVTGTMVNWTMLYLSNYIVSANFFHKAESSAAYPVNASSYTMILNDWKQSEEGINTLKQIPWLYDVMVKTDVNVGFLVAVLLAVVIAFFFRHSTAGYSLRALGSNATASEFAGINTKRKTVTAMFTAGAICGLGSALMITGTYPHRISQLAAFQSNGFNGMYSGFIALTSPIGCIFSGILFAGLIYCGQIIQPAYGIPSDVINITIGVIIFSVALMVYLPKVSGMLERRRSK